MSFLVNFIRILGQILTYAIFARILLSWLPIDRNSRIVVVLMEITEPILGPLRRVLPPIAGLDLSPMAGLILIRLAQSVLLGLVSQL